MVIRFLGAALILPVALPAARERLTDPAVWRAGGVLSFFVLAGFLLQMFGMHGIDSATSAFLTSLYVVFTAIALAAWTRTLPKALAARLMRENRVPAAQVRNLEEVTADPHMHKRGMLHDIDHPEMGKVVLPASPLRFHGSPDPSIQLEPAVGANTDDVLKEWLDMDDTAVSNLRDSNAVG